MRASRLRGGFHTRCATESHHCMLHSYVEVARSSAPAMGHEGIGAAGRGSSAIARRGLDRGPPHLLETFRSSSCKGIGGTGMTIDTGDTAWVLAATALVLFMTPGLALFYGGMVRAKNVLAMLMQHFFTMGWVAGLWALTRYPPAFGTFA